MSKRKHVPGRRSLTDRCPYVPMDTPKAETKVDFPPASDDLSGQKQYAREREQGKPSDRWGGYKR